MNRRQGSAVTALNTGQAGHWEQRGACRDTDPDLFHAGNDSGSGQPPHLWEWIALGTCSSCPVMARCQREALSWPAEHQHGVAGGMTAAQRRAAIDRRGAPPTKTGKETAA